MHTYVITFHLGEPEEISAATFVDVDGVWIDFTDGPGTKLHRLRADSILRIDIKQS